MSSPDKSEGISDHPPAVKAGGMRIVQNKKNLNRNQGDVPKPEEGSFMNTSASLPNPEIVQASGAVQKGNADFPPKAVQSFHDKPRPTHDKGAPSKPVVIQQPGNRKFTT